MKQIKQYKLVSHGYEHISQFRKSAFDFSMYSFNVTTKGETQKDAFDKVMENLEKLDIDTSKLKKDGAWMANIYQREIYEKPGVYYFFTICYDLTNPK
jgi:hypothetical protein